MIHTGLVLQQSHALVEFSCKFLPLLIAILVFSHNVNCCFSVSCFLVQLFAVRQEIGREGAGEGRVTDNINILLFISAVGFRLVVASP